MSMYTLRHFFWLLCGAMSIVVLPQSCLAQGASDEVLRSLGSRVEEFLRDVEGANMPNSVETLLTGSPLLNGDLRRVRLLQDTIQRELPKYGAFLKVESLKIERIGNSMVRFVYLYHCKNYPVVWYFTFYKQPGKSDWVVIALKFDVDYDKLPATPSKIE